MRLCDEYAEWCWSSRWHDGEFDFSDEADYRKGVDLFVEMVRKRYTHARPNSAVISRCQFGWRSILYQLKVKLDVREMAEEELEVTGWDRSEYTA